MEFAVHVEAERLEQIRETDARYHLAKLVAAAFNDPERIWDEHQEFLLGITAPSLPTPVPRMTPAHLATVGDVYRRLVEEGIVTPPKRGVQH